MFNSIYSSISNLNHFIQSHKRGLINQEMHTKNYTIICKTKMYLKGSKLNQQLDNFSKHLFALAYLLTPTR